MVRISIKKSLLLLIVSSYPLMPASQEQQKLETVFTAIYQYASWGVNQDGMGHSGAGSTVENTTTYRDFIEQFIQKNNIKSVVDFGCGDWEFSQHINWNNATYVGYDIVESVIAQNSKKHGSPSRIFIHANGLTHDLAPADLILCKDVLQHLSNENILTFLKQLKKYKYCLITNDIQPSASNHDIEDGGYRPSLNLSKKPFNLRGKFVCTVIPADKHAKKGVFLITPQNRKNLN